jgi:hypothetical protein
MKAMVQALCGGNRLPWTVRDVEGEDIRPIEKEVIILTHLQSDLGSNSFNKRTCVLTRLLLLREGQFPSRLFAQVLHLLRGKIWFVQFDGRDGYSDPRFCHIVWRNPRCML